MQRQPATLLVIATIMVFLAACTGGGLRTEVRGSGVLATDTRPVSGFDRILVSGYGRVILEITGTESLWVEGEDNILDVLTIEVVDGRLELGHRAFTNIVPTRDITYHITAASLDAAAVAGSGTLHVGKVDNGAFAVSVAGSGSVTPSGRTAQLTVEVNGSGSYVGTDLETETASVAVSGSGQAVVGASERLVASVSGSGSIRYLGDPLVAPLVSGSGSISPFYPPAPTATSSYRHLCARGHPGDAVEGSAPPCGQPARSPGAGDASADCSWSHWSGPSGSGNRGARIHA